MVCFPLKGRKKLLIKKKSEEIRRKKSVESTRKTREIVLHKSENDLNGFTLKCQMVGVLVCIGGSNGSFLWAIFPHPDGI